jgi:hypothetical protein
MDKTARFWAKWGLLSVATMAIAFVLGPFVGLNIVVWAGGWDLMRHLPYGTSELAGVVLLGVLSGLVSWRIPATELLGAGPMRRLSAIGAFALASLAGAGAYYIAGTALYTGIIPLCGGALVLWGLGLCLVLFLPLAWMRRPPVPVHAE